MLEKVNSFFLKCKRVWFALKKPSKEEFVLTSKVSAIGIGVLGVLGFAVSILIKLFF